MADTDGKVSVLISNEADESLQNLAPDYLQGERRASDRVQWALGLFFASDEAKQLATAKT